MHPGLYKYEPAENVVNDQSRRPPDIDSLIGDAVLVQIVGGHVEVRIAGDERRHSVRQAPHDALQFII
jgi:hypothetical protein